MLCVAAILNEVDVISVSKWLLCLHKSMDEFGRNEETLKCLKSMRMIPLSSGSVTSIDNDTVFFPLSMFSDKRGKYVIICSCLKYIFCVLILSDIILFYYMVWTYSVLMLPGCCIFITTVYYCELCYIVIM